MPAIIFRVIPELMKWIGFLIMTGLFVSVLADLQQKAFSSKKIGLLNMSSVNEQLVGKTK